MLLIYHAKHNRFHLQGLHHLHQDALIDILHTE
jgi:hypothetical protein